MSLVIVGVTSFIGAYLHLRRGNVAIGPGFLFSLTGMAASFIGSAGTHLLSRRSLMLIYALIMLLVGFAMLRGVKAMPGFMSLNALPVPWLETVDISNAVLWLASDEARYVTGVTLPVDAGAYVK